MDVGQRSDGPSRIGDYAEDALGFGGAEWRTARDLLVRPRDVLDAYLKLGSTGGGVYARPIRFYIALCGVLMFYLFLAGGSQIMMEMMPPRILDDLVARSGKTRTAFLDDADGWVSIVLVPILIPFYALSMAPLLRWWGGTSWRLSFRATFALLCAWTIPTIPLGPLPYLDGYAGVTGIVLLLLLVTQFIRMGRDRWWRSISGAVGKSIILYLAIQLGTIIGMIPVLVIGALSGLYGS